jgi:hypothetical protein
VGKTVVTAMETCDWKGLQQRIQDFCLDCLAHSWEFCAEIAKLGKINGRKSNDPKPEGFLAVQSWQCSRSGRIAVSTNDNLQIELILNSLLNLGRLSAIAC